MLLIGVKGNSHDSTTRRAIRFSGAFIYPAKRQPARQQLVGGPRRAIFEAADDLRVQASIGADKAERAAALHCKSQGNAHRVKANVIMLHQCVAPNTQLTPALRAAASPVQRATVFQAEGRCMGRA